MNNYNGVRHALMPVPDCGEAGHAEGACGTLECSTGGRRVLVVDMVLHCPACHAQHVDAPGADFDGYDHHWDNPPHRSHLCHSCGHIWRPADVCTNGVAAINTRGKNDSAPSIVRPAQPEVEQTGVSVGDTKFEGWYQAYHHTGAYKQKVRDAYAAGHEDGWISAGLRHPADKAARPALRLTRGLKQPTK